MCSHLAAFRIASNIRIDAMHHIVKLPLGFAETFGSGKLRKIVNESSAATETYLAHQLPDKAGAIATPIGLLALLFLFVGSLGSVKPCACSAGIFNYDKYDRRQNEKENGRISKCFRGHVQ